MAYLGGTCFGIMTLYFQKINWVTIEKLVFIRSELMFVISNLTLNKIYLNV